MSDFTKKYRDALGLGASEEKSSDKKKKENTTQDSFTGKYRKALGLDYSDVDDSYINMFIRDSQDYMTRSRKDLEGLSWKSATDKASYQSRQQTDDDLSVRAGRIRAYLNKYKSQYDGKQLSDVVSYLDAFSKDRLSISSTFRDAQKFYSQWETEDDYKAYVAQQEDYEAKKNFDLDAGQREISELEKKRAELQRSRLKPSNNYLTGDSSMGATPYGARSQGEYEGDTELAELDALISQKKTYLNQAKHIQKGVALSGVDGNEDFRQNSRYQSTKKANPEWWENGVGDTQYEWINNRGGFREEWEQSQANLTAMSGASSQSGVYLGPQESPYKQKGYDLLHDHEIAIYNYYYAKEGPDKAQEYLDSIQETLNQRKAENIYGTMEEQTLLELAFGVAAGLDQFSSGVQALFNTKDDYIPQSAIQMASGMVREDLADNGPKLPEWMGGASLGQVGYDAITTTANMAPSILTSVAANALLPGSGAIVGNTMMFASAAGNAYQEALNYGYDKSQARAYSTLVGASEAGLQYILGGIGALGGKASGGIITKMLSGVDNAFLRTAGKIGGNMLSEGLEEGLQEILTPMFKNFALHADEDINWSEAAYSFLLGALTAGFMEGPTTISNAVSLRNTGKQLKEADISANRLAEIGKTFAADTVAHQLAGRVNENTGAYTLGRLFNEIGATLTEQNVNDITEALIKEGLPSDMAKEKAKQMAQIVAGATLTEEGIRAVEEDTLFARAVKATIIDPNATWYQRTRGYNEALMALAKEKASPAKAAQQSQGNMPASDNVDAQNETGSKAAPEADTAPAKVKKISAINKGVATVMLEDGTEVNVRDADLDPDDGVRIETIANIDGISAADADYILGALRAAPGASAQMDSLGAREAYKYGFYGFSQEHLAKTSVFASSLTETQRQRIYELGQKARVQQTEKAPATKSATTGKQVYFDSGNGNVVAFSEAKKTGLSKTQKAGVQAAMVLHKLGIGGDIYFFESYRNSKGQLVYKDKNGVEQKAPNGWYSEKDGSIHIDLNAGTKGQGYVLYTLSHELTHFIEQWSPKKYKALADFLVENYEKGQSMDKLVRAKQAKLSELRGEKISYKEAYSEVVADSMEAMLADGNVLDKLIALKAKDHSLFNKMKQFFDNLVAKIRSIYKGLTPDSVEGNAVLEMKDSIEKLQQLFADALVEASENFQSAMESVVESGAEAVSENEIITDGAVVTDGEGNKFSIRSMKTDIAEGQMFEDLKKYCGWTQKQVNELRKNLEDLVAYMTPFRDVLDMNETYDREGRRFSPYKPNSDPLYKISMDFSTLCSKRLLTQYVIENLQLRENRPMSAEEQMAIRDMLNEYRKVEKGLQVACAMCYVEAARLKSPQQINKWLADPATQMKNYFADKNADFANFIKEKQADFKESRGYDRNATKKDMSAKDVRELNKIRPKLRSQYQLSAEEAKIVERAKALPNSTYLTAGNLAALSETDPTIYAAYTAFVRTATRSKSLETDEPYYYGDSRRDNGNGIIVTDSFIEAVNRENGMRFSSWSDWRIQHLLDYITAVIDNSVRGAAMHGYTKFGEEVRVLGKTGMMFNMSGVAGSQTGLNEDGSLSFSPTESIDANEAIQLRDEFPDTAGLQCIGVGDDHIVALLRSDIIDYVIPYHVSGLNAALRAMANIHGWKDYTSTQHAAIDKSIKFEDAVDQEHWHEEPIYSEFFVGYDTGMTGIEAMRASADRYIQMCKDRGLKPKFEQFSTEENYWKLLIDRKMINQKTGNLIQQKPVTPTFDFGTIKEVVDRYVKNYDSNLEARALNHIVENWDSIPQRIRDLKKQGGKKAKKASEAVDTLANQTLAAQPVREGPYSMRDIDIDRVFIEYGDAVAENAEIEKVVASLVSRGKVVKINAESVKKHGTGGKWATWQAARDHIKGILEKFIGKSVYFEHNKQYAEAYLTRAGIDHSAGGVITAERAEIFEQFKKLVKNAEYAFSSKNDPHSNSNKKISGRIDWDCFVAVAMIGEEPFPVVFKIRTIDNDVRSQIHEMSMKKEINGSHDPDQQDDLLRGMSTYRVVPSISGDKVSQDDSDVKHNSDRDTLTSDQKKHFDYNQKQSTVGSTLKTLKGSAIKRSSKYGVGKEIGGEIYFHKDYAEDIIPDEVLSHAQHLLEENHPGFEYNCLKYNPKTGVVAFQEAPDFDSAREPVVGDYVSVNTNNGAVKTGHSNYIWHHKWNWVKNDYSGFDVDASWNWSKKWLSTLTEVSDGNGIERWNAQLDKYGLPHDGEPKLSGIRFQLREVDPVKPTSSDWQPAHNESWFAENGFPLYRNVSEEQRTANEQYEMDKRSGGHGTQNLSTLPTYKKIFEFIKARGDSPRILDASAGLGAGTELGKEYGLDIHDIEPYPNKDYKPEWTDYDGLQKHVESGAEKPFDLIISNAVLNVLAQDSRDNLVAAMDSLLAPGGQMFINVIGKDYAGAVNATPEIQRNKKGVPVGTVLTQEGENGAGREVFVWTSNSVQKVFSPQELKSYLSDALGEGYKIETPARAWNGSKLSGTMVVITKPGDSEGRLLYSFRGEKAQNIDKAALNHAKELDKKRVPMEVIRSKTGWWKQSDGKWRNEFATKDFLRPEAFNINGLPSAIEARIAQVAEDDQFMIDPPYYTEEDSKAYVEKVAAKLRREGLKHGTLDDFLYAPELYAAYPHLRNIGLHITDLPEGKYGEFDSTGRGTIYLLPSYAGTGYTAREILLHEIQHAIQRYEGFAYGTNVKAAGSYAAYLNNKGEIEARDVAERWRYTDEDRYLYDPVYFSDRDAESVSNRSLLANALEGVAQNDMELQKMQEYKGKIALIEAEEQKLAKLKEQIRELSFAKGPKDIKKIRELQFEATQTANRINTLDKMLLRLEAAKPLQDVLTREKKMAYQRAEQKGKEALAAYRERATKTQRELMEKWQESRKKGIESREKTAMRHKIKTVVSELNQYLLQGNKEKRVMMPLKKVVAETLDAVNMDTVGAAERIAKLEAEMMKARTPEQIQEISRKIDHIRQMGDRMGNRLKALKDAYREIVESDDPLIANAHDDVIEAKLESVIDHVGNTPLRDMNLSQLEEVYDMYRMVLTTIRNANKAFKAAKSENISTLANRVMEEVEQVGGKKQYSIAALENIKKFGWNNLKPVYAFEHIGSGTLTQIFNNVRKGEDVWAVDVSEAREYYLQKSTQYHYDSWDFSKLFQFTSSSGMDFSLNLEQIMSLYAYSKRDQAADHLKRGGIVIDESTEITMKTKLGFKVKFNPTEATAYNISEETLAEIVGHLTDEQKGYVDEMQDYLSTVMGAKGNEVSLELYGIKLFKEKFYFPLKSASQFMAKAKEQQQGEVKIKSSGFSKETVKKANNPIVLTPFMNVWSNHVNEMSMYHAFVLPMEDFYRVYNYRTPTSDTMATESVEMFIQNAYGKGATGYIDQLLKDLNGGARTDSTTGLINKMMGLFKKGSVFASLSVVVQQPSAIARAAALVNTKYFIGPKVDHKRHKLLWAEVKQYAPVAIIKEMGYFDTNMGKSTQDFILGKEYSGFSEKMKALVTDSGYRDEVLSKAPALADELAWCSIWEAVKREMHDKYPGLDAKSEPFLMLAGSRFTEVITKTQVYDSVLSRSAMMRSKDTGMKMATAFMAEPTTSINMVADALLQGKRGNRKYTRAAIGAVIASQILNSILVSFVYAGRDDDENETYWEKYIGTLSGEILDSLNPAGYIPFIKDIMSIVQGYDVERSDMAVVSDLWKAWENLKKDTVSPYRKVEGFAGSIAQIFGLPVKNIMRDARGIYQTVNSFLNGQQTTKAGIGYAVKSAAPKWMGGGDVSNQQQLYEAILSGDKTQIAKVKARYKDEDAASAAIRKALRENDPRIKEAAQAQINGDPSERVRIARLIIADGFSQDDVVRAINAEINAMNSDESSSGTKKEKGFYTASDFAAEIAGGDQAAANAVKMDIIQTAQRNGKSKEEAEKSFASSAKGDMKELFLEGKISEDRAIHALTAYCGDTQEDAEKRVGEWAFEDEYGFTYSDRGDAYKSGAISAQELRTILIEVGGKTEEEADLQIQVYDWTKEVPGSDDITVSAIRDYNENCEPMGISKRLYYEAWTAYKEIDGDYDTNGDSIPYSKVRNVMPYINGLDLTAAQKTALALCWWAESTVQKYRLW